MAKIKMRCGRCSKKFTASSTKQTFCPECEAKVRAERSAAKAATTKPAGAPAAQAPKIVGPGAGILVPGLVATSADAPPEPGNLGLGHGPGHGHGAHQPREGQGGTPRDARAASGPAAHGAPAKAGAHAPADTRAPRADQEKGAHGVRTQQPKSPRPPREPKAPRPAPPSFELTDELRTQIEQRYLELAQPVEFDGIRTQIASELGVPKALVKKAVIDLRTRMQMPSWWELQTYTGGTSDLDRIRRAYVPHLPVPPIGIHKIIAQELGFDTGVVYQGIKRIRAEMRLPRFNPPELHESEAGSGGDGAQQEAPESVGATTETADAGSAG